MKSSGEPGQKRRKRQSQADQPTSEQADKSTSCAEKALTPNQIIKHILATHNETDTYSEGGVIVDGLSESSEWEVDDFTSSDGFYLVLPTQKI